MKLDISICFCKFKSVTQTFLHCMFHRIAEVCLALPCGDYPNKQVA
jgi:hypothetical protein